MINNKKLLSITSLFILLLGIAFLYNCTTSSSSSKASAKPEWVQKPSHGIKDFDPNLYQAIVFRTPNKSAKLDDVAKKYFEQSLAKVSNPKVKKNKKSKYIDFVSKYLAQAVDEKDRYFSRSENLLYIRGVIPKDAINQAYNKYFKKYSGSRGSGPKINKRGSGGGKSSDKELFNQFANQFKKDTQSGFCDVRGYSRAASSPGASNE